MSQEPTKKHHNKEGVRYSFGGDCRRLTRSGDDLVGHPDESVSLLLPGETCFLNDSSKVMVGVVGAGICITLFDKKLRFGAMVCPLITLQMCEIFPKFDQVGDSIIAKVVAPIDNAISEMKKNGSAKGNVRIRLFGGADLPDDELECGTKNYVFVKEYLKKKQLPVMGEDVGGANRRRVHFSPEVGSVTRLSLRRDSDFDDLKKSEQLYFDTL